MDETPYTERLAGVEPAHRAPELVAQLRANLLVLAASEVSDEVFWSQVLDGVDAVLKARVKERRDGLTRSQEAELRYFAHPCAKHARAAQEAKAGEGTKVWLRRAGHIEECAEWPFHRATEQGRQWLKEHPEGAAR